MSARIEVFPEFYYDKKVTRDAALITWSYHLPTGRWLWRLVGASGETVCVSEAYTRKASARRGARRALAICSSLDWRETLGHRDGIVEVES